MTGSSAHLKPVSKCQRKPEIQKSVSASEVIVHVGSHHSQQEADKEGKYLYYHKQTPEYKLCDPKVCLGFLSLIQISKCSKYHV